MNIVFQLDFTETPDADDNLAMQHIVFLENQRRERINAQSELANIAAEKENSIRSKQIPPLEQVPIIAIIPLLKVSTLEDLKVSYLEVRTVELIVQHLSDIKLAKSITGLASRYTKEETERIFANITIPLNRGVAKIDVIEDTDIIASKPAP